jgi:hypothetical protein
MYKYPNTDNIVIGITASLAPVAGIPAALAPVDGVVELVAGVVAEVLDCVD